jgi:hypothetical protein
MPYSIIKTRITPPGYRVQKISDRVFLTNYDMTLIKAKNLLSGIILSESKKIDKFYKQCKTK